jgi:hypothetical protein
MRKSRIAAAGVVVAALVSADPATANAPQGNGLGSIPATCTPQGGVPAAVTLTVTSGASFWIGDQKYVLKTMTFTNDGDSFTKDSGNKNGLTGGSIPLHR